MQPPVPMQPSGQPYQQPPAQPAYTQYPQQQFTPSPAGGFSRFASESEHEQKEKDKDKEKEKKKDIDVSFPVLAVAWLFLMVLILSPVLIYARLSPCKFLSFVYGGDKEIGSTGVTMAKALETKYNVTDFFSQPGACKMALHESLPSWLQALAGV